MDEKKTAPEVEAQGRNKKDWTGGVPDWAWYITWAIMLAALIKSFF